MNRTWIFAWWVCGVTLAVQPFATRYEIYADEVVGNKGDGTSERDRAGELYRVGGRFIELTTDLTSREEAETLVASFDAAVPQWASFWNLADEAVEDWKVTAFVMRDKPRFASQGLIPVRVPNFPYGYALDDSVWVMAQPSQYYTRHLLLHEGAHALSFHCFGGAGPTWFMEGTAELLATHSGQGESIRVLDIPANKSDVPYWGRFTKIGQLRSDAAVVPIEQVMAYPPTLSGDVESYALSWVAASMFATYPQYRRVLEDAASLGRETGDVFNRQIKIRLSKDWPVVDARWRLATNDLDFGFDWQQQRVEISVSDPLWDGKPITLAVQADRGWQSPGVRVPAGAHVNVRATGRITLANEPKPWISEPPGVTIQYVGGRPMGQLIACVLPNQPERQDKLTRLDIRSVGDQSTLRVASHSWLLFKVNDAVGNLDDNAGQYEVTIEPASGSPRR